MEGVKQGVRSLAKESSKNGTTCSSSSCYSEQHPASLSVDKSTVLLRRTHGHMVSLSTCSKLVVVGFIAGVVVGYTLKRRVRRWASKLLKRLKDD